MYTKSELPERLSTLAQTKQTQYAARDENASILNPTCLSSRNASFSGPHLQPDETNILDASSKCRHQRATGGNKWLNKRVCPLSLEPLAVPILNSQYIEARTQIKSLALFAFSSLLLGLRVVVLFG